MKLASFDIFDTTLLRLCGAPENIFYILSQRLYPSDKIRQNAFFLWRMEAERKAVIQFQHTNLSLREIYSVFDRQAFPDLDIESVIEKEIEVEMDNLIPVAYVKDLIARKREEGYTICFISDMYLPSQVLKKKLQDEGCALPEDIVFVSCEYKATKREGGLYDIVRAHFKHLTHWEHMGDNVSSDYKSALKKKITAYLISTGYTEMEKQAMKQAMSFPGGTDFSILAGIQRAARLTSGIRNADVDNAADMIASMYVPYVSYLFRKAREEGVRHLYFLSRDGYILQQIAEEYQKNYPEITLHYLFVSRYSLFLPNIYSLSKEELYECKGGSPLYVNRIKVSDLLQDLRVDRSDLDEDFKKHITFKRIKTKEQEDLFFEYLQSSGLKQRIVAKAAEERALVVDYFRQEGLFSEYPWAIVDVGWIGTTRLMINRILEREGGYRGKCFYLGTAPEVLSIRYGSFDSYYGTHLYTPSIMPLIEQYYCVSPYASTKGYARDDTGIKPVFKERRFTQNEELVRLTIQTVRKVARYTNALHLADCDFAMSVWGGLYLKVFFNMESTLQLSTFEKLGVFEDGSTHSSLVKKVNPLEVLSYLYKGKIKEIIFPRHSIYYTLKIKFFRPENSLREVCRSGFKKCSLRLRTFKKICRL